MKVQTSRFGAIKVDESSVIRMPRGPIGFQQYTSFVIVEHRPDTDFRWLQSTDEPSLAFVVVDPSKFYTEYEIEIPRRRRRETPPHQRERCQRVRGDHRGGGRTGDHR